MMDYMGCIGTYFPNVFVSCIGDSTVYSNIIWESGDPLPTQAILDTKIFQDVQTSKIAELSANCQAAITAGFLSSAIGGSHLYDSQEVDQLNLIGATAN